MPPSVARLEVEVSGPKPRPCGMTARLRSSCTTPGPTRTRAALEVDLPDRVHVARGVEHDALAGGLAGEARAGAARDDRDARARRRSGPRRRRRRRRAGTPRAAARWRTGWRRRRRGGGCSRRRARRRAAPAPGRLESPYRSDPYPARRMSHRSGRHFLQIPGPTNVPDRVLRAIDAPTIDHRGPDFARLGLEVLEGLREVFQTSGPVVVYPSSGTGAWEAALVNTLQPGDRVLAFETGHFATLWRGMAERLGLDVRWVEGDWRHGVAARGRAGGARGRPGDRRGHGRPQRDLDRRHEPDPRDPRRDRRGGQRRPVPRRRHLVARVDRLPARGVGRRRHRRRLPEGPDAAGRAGLQRGVAAGGRGLADVRVAALLLGLGADPRGERERLLALHVGHQPALRAARGARDAARGGAADRVRPPRAPRRGDARRGRGVGPRGAGASTRASTPAC